MKLHYGQIVEKRVRQSGFSITEVARNAQVNRRSVYNWFNQRELNTAIIYRLGCAMNHDFSVDFPDLFSSSDFIYTKDDKNLVKIGINPYPSENDDETWRIKYNQLLKLYNSLLTNVG